MSPVRRTTTAGVTALAVGTALLVGSVPAGADAPASPVPGIPPGAPPALLAPEPDLPAAAGWPGSEAFPRTSGTFRLDGGAVLWSDWLFDDTGTGSFTYAEEDARSNGADVFRAGIAADEDASYWRIDWNTLVADDVPIAAWTFDTDADATTGVSQWPAGAGATSPGMETALVVTGSAARLIDLATGEETDVATAGGALTVDLAARSFVVRVPREVLPVDGTWTVRLAAGIADDSGGFAPAPESGDGTRIYNAAFRDLDDESHATLPSTWNNARQSARLADGDMSDFALDVTWTEVLGGTTTPEPLPTGFSTRWFVSGVDLGQGRHPGARVSPGPALQPAQFYGRVQPYTIYVPTAYDPAQPAPLSILLHGGGGNHNAFLGARQAEVYEPMCEERGSICVSPLGRGVGTWFIEHGELDVWEVWNRTAATYTLDPDRTVIGGFSMGGVGTTRFATNYPHLFAAAGIHSGAGYFNAAGVRDREDAELRVENLGALRTFIDSGSRDIALGATRNWDAAAEASGIPYRAHYYDGADHGMLSWLPWADLAEYVEGVERTAAPAEFVFRFEPEDEDAELGSPVDRAYWVSGLEPRDTEARWSRVTALSEALRTELTEPVMTEETRTIGGRLVEVRDQQLVVVGDAESRNAVALTAENLAALTVDLDAAGLSAEEPATLVLDTDGDIVLTLQRSGMQTVFELAAGEHELAIPAEEPTPDPTEDPTVDPTEEPTAEPTEEPTAPDPTADEDAAGGGQPTPPGTPGGELPSTGAPLTAALLVVVLSVLAGSAALLTRRWAASR